MTISKKLPKKIERTVYELIFQELMGNKMLEDSLNGTVIIFENDDVPGKNILMLKDVPLKDTLYVSDEDFAVAHKMSSVFSESLSEWQFQRYFEGRMKNKVALNKAIQEYVKYASSFCRDLIDRRDEQFNQKSFWNR